MTEKRWFYSLAVVLALCAPAIQDGEGALVETKADGPCYPTASHPDRNSRYFDCGNGTVLDTVTGLLWLKLANCLSFLSADTGHRTWWDAVAFVDTLAHGNCLLTDESQPGDWRLATIEEWEKTVAYAASPALNCLFSNFGSQPSLTNDAGTGCLKDGPTSFAIDVVDYSGQFWAQDSFVDFGPGGAGNMRLSSGDTVSQMKDNGLLIWPVRPVDR